MDETRDTDQLPCADDAEKTTQAEGRAAGHAPSFWHGHHHADAASPDDTVEGVAPTAPMPGVAGQDSPAAEDVADTAEHPVAPTQPGSTGYEQGVEVLADPNQEGASRRRVWPFVLGGIVVAIIVAALAYLALNPGLDDETVRAAAKGIAWSNEELSSSQWASNVGYEVTGVSIAKSAKIDAGETPTGSTGQRVLADVTLKNASFQVVATTTMDFCKNASGEWYCYAHELREKSVTPLGGIQDGMVLAAFPDLLLEADAYGVDGLTAIYDETASFSMAQNSTSAEGGSATVSLSARKGLVGYSGTATVNFTFDRDDWQVSSVTVSDDATQADYSGAEGTWQGTLTDTSAPTTLWIFPGGGVCYAGSTQPATVQVTSVDSDQMTATATVTFVAHNHGTIENDATWSDGDETVTVEGVVFKLGGYGFTESYSGTVGDSTYHLYFTSDLDAGTLALRVTCDHVGSLATWTWSDSYSLAYAS